MNESLHERFVIFEQFYIIFLFTIGFIGNTISFCLFSLTDLRYYLNNTIHALKIKDKFFSKESRS